MSLKYRFKFDKVVRDKIPEILTNSGVYVQARRLDLEEYVQRLMDKLLEEAREVSGAEGSQKKLKEELVDVLEVVIALADTHALTLQDILQERERKRAEKGGFESRMYIDFIETMQEDPISDYYKASPHKYPKDV